MNERILELARVAEQLADDELAHLERVHNRLYSFTEGREIYNKKFAELIVGECFYCVEIMEKIAHASNADIPPDYDRQTYLKTLEAVKGLMKAHFGVEK